MPVGHGGDMSKHTAWEKVVLLELLEQRLKWAATEAGADHTQVHVYDPFTTDMDFYIFFEGDISWDKYLEIYRYYYDEDLPAYNKSYTAKIPGVTARTHIESVLKDEEIQPAKYIEAFPKALAAIRDYDEKEIFNASTSKTMILYTVAEMKNILNCGKPDGCP